MRFRTLYCVAILLTAVLYAPYGTAQVVGENSESNSLRVVSSYYHLPDGITVMKSFPDGAGAIVAQFQQKRIAVSELMGKAKEHGYGFVGQSLVVAQSLHGTTDAPFSRSMFTIQHPAGVRMIFDEPQAVVAMTIVGPTIDTDVGIDLLFLDTKLRLLKRVPADTQHVKGLNFDSRGAVFRGLWAEKPIIGVVDIVPTRILDNSKIVLADIDYFCFSKEAGAGSPTGTVRELVAALGDEQYRTREDAAKRLASFRPHVIPILRSMQAGDDPEVRSRLAGVINALESKKVNLTPDGTSE